MPIEPLLTELNAVPPQRQIKRGITNPTLAKKRSADPGVTKQENKMPNPSRNKGNREEREVVNLHKEWGLHALRTLESGARNTGPTWDIDLFWRGAALKGECKVRGDGYKTIYDQLGSNDFLTLRADHKERLYVVPERVWKKLLGAA